MKKYIKPNLFFWESFFFNLNVSGSGDRVYHLKILYYMFTRIGENRTCDSFVRNRPITGL